MRLSQFTIFIPDFPSKEKYMVYNTFNQSTIFVGKHAKDIMCSLDHTVKEEDQKYIDTFKELQFIVDDDYDEAKELRDWYETARHDKSVLRATILTTYNCNFACEYCVEEGVKAALKMDDDISKATVNWLINKVEKIKANEIQLLFYGGEPLMNTKPIYHIASELSDYSSKNGISFNFTITTNGSLLKPELVDDLTPLGLKSVKITIDGDKEAHNLKRPFKGGKGSFDVIIGNIKQIVEKTNIKISSNVDSTNAGNIPPMLDYLEQIGLKDKIDLVSFSPIVRIQNPDGTSLLSRKSDCGISNDLDLGNLTKLNWSAFLKGFKTRTDIGFTICSMNRDGTVLVIDPLGRIYTCPAFVGREGFQT
ncbi:4Fe-4S cluster-binding domain-containing protein, partial [Candidatus Poribacteria bacterium]|nr:4Fe-4S cluster-binding domain-containing protein [Candidatus Poribacteria bacterium]